jgi:SRSO17 transposase
VDGIGALLGDDVRRASFATYTVGLISDGERKSMEPIACRACPDPKKADAAHQRLHNFVSNSAWSDRDVRRESARYALAAMEKREPIVAWLIDDTGFLKQGKHSVGVQRQYTGSAGKVTNCQIGASLCLATKSQQVPVDFELYLPKPWANKKELRKEGHIPDDVQFQTKPELALGMIQRAVDDKLPKGIVLTDAAYGTSSAFRAGLRDLDLDYAVAVESATKVWRMDRLLRRRGEALSVKKLAATIGKKAFRRVTWRQGTSEKLSARFAFQRVVPFHNDGIDPSVREDVWLVMEWEDDKPAPTKFYFATLPKKMSKKQLVRIIKVRWRTERMYEDMKGQLGLDHFEGRAFRGWHHHISAVLFCYSFVVAEHANAFPPSA